MFKQAFKFLIILLLFSTLAYSDNQKKRVVYLNSYHSGFFWSDTIKEAILNVFQINDKINLSNSSIELKIIEMDSKRNKNEKYLKNIALRIKKQIEEYQPDIIISSDDNAAKYVIAPYFYNHHIPVIFCGINGDSSIYNFPANNITGMIEVELIEELIHTISPYTRGNKIGYLDDNTLSQKKTLDYFKKSTKKDIKGYFITDIESWKKSFLKAQDEVDILILGSGGVILNKENIYKELSNFVKKTIKIPTIGWSTQFKDSLVLTFEKEGREQGEWAAKTALEVLGGKDIKDIPVTKNKEARILINTILTKKLNIVFPLPLIQDAILISK